MGQGFRYGSWQLRGGLQLFLDRKQRNLHRPNVRRTVLAHWVEDRSGSGPSLCSSVTSSRCPASPLCSFVLNYSIFFLKFLMASSMRMRSGTPLRWTQVRLGTGNSIQYNQLFSKPRVAQSEEQLCQGKIWCNRCFRVIIKKDYGRG